MSIQHITTLMEFCLKNGYFLFQGKSYEQVHDAAIRTPISPIVANLFMEEFEIKGYVDDIFVIQTEKTQQPMYLTHQFH